MIYKTVELTGETGTSGFSERSLQCHLPAQGSDSRKILSFLDGRSLYQREPCNPNTPQIQESQPLVYVKQVTSLIQRFNVEYKTGKRQEHKVLGERNISFCPIDLEIYH